LHGSGYGHLHGSGHGHLHLLESGRPAQLLKRGSGQYNNILQYSISYYRI
jgi:hypothetical protein